MCKDNIITITFNIDAIEQVKGAFLEYSQQRYESYKTFGIRYDIPTKAWTLVAEADLGIDVFSLTNAGNTSGLGLDNSWFLKLSFNNNKELERSKIKWQRNEQMRILFKKKEKKRKKERKERKKEKKERKEN